MERIGKVRLSKWSSNRETMCERKNTLVCSFERDSPRISALDIHDWIFEKLAIPETEVRMIQIDGIKR